MKTSLPERRIAAFWEKHAAELSGLETEEDGPVCIMFPGRLNDDHGADFRDAILGTRHGLTIGDIEIHTASGGWWEHRHHRDPAYNRVILHVVGRHDSGRTAELQNGRTVPTLTIGRYLEPVEKSQHHSLDTTGLLPCRRNGKPDLSVIGSILDTAGETRFRFKTDTFRRELAAEDPAQVMYRAFMGALGYRRNREPMRRLAGAIPWQHLAAAGEGLPDDKRLAQWQGLLLGCAGLLPSQRRLRTGGSRDDRVDMLEQAWRTHGGAPALSEPDWHFSRVRPGNYPVRRIAAMSYLMLKSGRDGGFSGLVNSLGGSTPRETMRSLTVPAPGYWGQYLDFGQGAIKPAPALCGPGRAADIVLNVLLPFHAACLEGLNAEAAPVLKLYRTFPALEDNAILREMRGRLGLSTPLVTTAARQQGLLHIHHTWCAAGRCDECPLGAGRISPPGSRPLRSGRISGGSR